MKEPELVKRFKIEKPNRFRLKDLDPGDTAGLDLNKAAATSLLAKHIERLANLQQRLYAEHTWALLIILQGVDAAGKDSTIRHVMSGLNPLGCHAHSFKPPSADELDHDFLWRAAVHLPRRGSIGIFNRSHYEEVLVVRVHHDLLANERLPPKLVTKRIWDERFEDINAFERYLTRNGTAVVKIHLLISKEEQTRRLLERLDDPAKRWKFSLQDVAERKLWDPYMDAYEEMIRNTSTREAPWYVVPADHKWFAHLVVAKVMIDVLDQLDLQIPKADQVALRELKQIREALMEQ